MRTASLAWLSSHFTSVDKNNFGPRVGFAWDIFKNGKTVLRAVILLNYDLPNFGTIHAPQTYLQAVDGYPLRFLHPGPRGHLRRRYQVRLRTTTWPLFAGRRNTLCATFICMAPGVNIYGPERYAHRRLSTWCR